MIHLLVRTPHGLLLDEEVQAIAAEDLDGWFGVRPGRAPLVAVLPAGLLVARDTSGERFVALSGGLLHVEADACRVMAKDAVVTRELDAVPERFSALFEARAARRRVQEDIVVELSREALRRLAEEART